MVKQFSKVILKKYIFLFFLLIFLSPYFCFSNDTPQKEIIKVGYIEGYSFIFNKDAINKKGYGYDFLKEIEKHSNFVFELCEVSEDVWYNFDSFDIDLLGGAFYHPDGESYFEYVYPPLTTSEVSLVVRNNSDKKSIYYNDPNSINGKTVATNVQNVGNDILDEYLLLNNISVDYVYGAKDSYLQLPADLFVHQDNHYLNYEFSSVLDLASFNCHLVVKKGNTKLREKLEKAVNTVLSDSKFMAYLKNKYVTLTPSPSNRLLSKDESSALLSKKWKIGFDQDNAPYQYINDNGEPDGFTVKIMQDILENYGFEAEFIPYNASNEVPLPEKYDILLSHLGQRDDIINYYQPTDVYYEYPIYFVNNTSLLYDEVDDETLIRDVAMMQYIGFDEILFHDTVSNFNIITYYDYNKLFDDILSGKVKNALLTQAGIDYIKLHSEKKHHFNFYSTTFTVPLNLFIAKEFSEEYNPIFNVILASLPKTDLEFTFIEETSEGAFRYGIWDFLIENIIYIILVVVFALGIFFAWRVFILNKTKKTILNILNTDDVTGLASFHYFTNTAESILSCSLPNEYELITLDIDAFKTVNTYFGSEIGTDTIKLFGQTLSKGFEGIDALIARISGDQFIILRKTNQIRHIQLVCLHTVLPALEILLGENFPLSLSIGTYTIDSPTDSINDIISRANIARLKGKNLHSTTFYDYDATMRKNHEKATMITLSMELALQNHEFITVLQPKIDLNTFKICGAEALVRWKKEDGTVVYPDDFIPLFEANGFIIELDIYMFREACKFIKKTDATYEMPPVSVNFSAKTLEQREPIGNIIKIAKSYDIKPGQIEIELTESALANSHDIFMSNLKKLKEHGFAVSIDDFGAGTSTLNRLTTFDADIVKLDKVFLDVHDEKKEYVIVENVISMSKDLNLKVVSEGVETAEQASVLKEMGCDIAQGYYFDKPLSIEDFESRLKEDKTYSI